MYFSGHTVQALGTSSAPSSSRLSPVRPEGKHEVPAEHEPKVALRKRKAESEGCDLGVVPAGGKLAKSESSSTASAAQEVFDPPSFVQAFVKAESKLSAPHLTPAGMQNLYAQAIESLTPQQLLDLGREMRRMEQLFDAQGQVQASVVFDPLVRVLTIARDRYDESHPTTHWLVLPILPKVLELLRGMAESLHPSERREFIRQFLGRAHHPAAHRDLEGKDMSYEWLVIPHLIQLACQLMPQEHGSEDDLRWFLEQLLVNNGDHQEDRRRAGDAIDQLHSALAFLDSFPGAKTQAEAVFRFVLEEAEYRDAIRGWFKALATSNSFQQTQVKTLIDSVWTDRELPPWLQKLAAKYLAMAAKYLASALPVNSTPASKPPALPEPETDAGSGR